jgi:hypothetical protein
MLRSALPFTIRQSKPLRGIASRPAVYFLLALFFVSAASAQNAREFVQRAVSTELAAERNDHSKWLYRELDRKPGDDVLQWVAESTGGSVTRVLRRNGQPISAARQRSVVDAFIHSTQAQAKQRQDEQHDDRQAESLLKMLPNGFRWKIEKTTSTATILQFQPNPGFHPPTREARVFSAMAGTMVVNDSQQRIQGLKGHLIRDVDFGWWGVLGKLEAGGTFDVERHETGSGVWQITETHVHIHGHALLFKTISEEEDDIKTDFKRLPEETDLQQAAKIVMSQPE